MKTLSQDMFKTLAGDAAYERGEKYYSEGRVGELIIQKNKITADVTGTQPYKVMLQHTAKLFEGECNCPASNNFDFCKHCVAVALKYYYQTQSIVELADSPEPNRLLGFLETLTQQELVQELHRLIISDSELHDHWQLKTEIASGGVSTANLRKRITKAIAYKPSGLWRYRDVVHYFELCTLGLKALHEPLFALEAKDTLKLITYALQRFEKTLETIDDSGGYRFELQELLINWFELAVCNQALTSSARVDGLTKMALEQKYNYDCVDLQDTISRHCSSTEQTAIYKKLHGIWAKLSPTNEAYSKEQYYYQRLERFLLKRARQQNDLEQEFKIRERGAVSVDSCLTLIELCSTHQRFSQAEKWLDYASKLKQLSTREIYDLESAKINLLKAQQKFDLAIKIQWARFEEQEVVERLDEVLATAKALNEGDAWLDKGIALLKSKLDRREQTQKNRQRAESLVSIYLSNQRIDSALDLSRTSLLRPETLMAIVKAMPKLNERAFKLIEKSVNLYLNHTGNMVYERAVDFLLKQSKRVDDEQQEKFQQTVYQIFSEPKNVRKTNFVKRLKVAFPEQF